MSNGKVKYISIILLILVLFIYLVISINSYMNNSKIGIFSIRFYIMSSNSEEAGITAGDLVFAKDIKTEQIKENDDIIFKRNNELIVKKVKEVTNTNRNINFYIQEDSIITNEKIENAQIIGKVVGKIKGIGNMAIFIQSPMGTLSVLLIIICVIIIIKKIMKKVQKDANDEEKSN